MRGEWFKDGPFLPLEFLCGQEHWRLAHRPQINRLFLLKSPATRQNHRH